MKLTSAFLAAAVIAGPLAAQYPNSGSPIGINLLSVSDFGTQIPWYDMFKWFRGWATAVPSDGNFPASQLDAQGWVKSLEAGQEAWVGHGAGTGGHYPGGNYLLTWEGDGTIGTRQGCSFVSYDSVNHRAVVRVDSTQAWFGIKITRTNPANYVRNMHMYMPGFWDTGTYQLKAEYRNDPWHPEFIGMLQRFRCIRFMDWLGTNGSPIVNWSDFRPGDHWNQSGWNDGTTAFTSPLWCIRLCNRLHADGWFCMPHQATDDCMRQFARLIRDSLDPGLKAYIEFSNECWNWMFVQTGWCRDLSVDLGVSSGPAEGYAIRSAEMWAIFEQEFAGQTGRVVNVLACQAVIPTQFRDYMIPFINNTRYNPAGTRPEVLAVAPYISNESLPISQLTHDQWFDRVLAEVVPENRTMMGRALAEARSLGLPMVTYEGGQHFVGSSTNAVNFYVAANRHPRMKDVYLAYLNSWFSQGGGLFMHYADCGLGGQYGSWGAKEWYNQPRAQAPKYDALLTFIEDSIGLVSVPRPESRGVAAAGVSRDAADGLLFSLLGRALGVIPRQRLWLSDRQAPGVSVVDKGRLAPFVVQR